MIHEFNGNKIQSEHKVEVDPKTHHVCVRCTFSHDESGKTIDHVLTLGAVDQPLPANYDKAALQKDIDAFKTKYAEVFEGKIRAAQIASEIE
jgi:hypothetical protein